MKIFPATAARVPAAERSQRGAGERRGDSGSGGGRSCGRCRRRRGGEVGGGSGAFWRATSRGLWLTFVLSLGEVVVEGTQGGR